VFDIQKDNGGQMKKLTILTLLSVAFLLGFVSCQPEPGSSEEDWNPPPPSGEEFGDQPLYMVSSGSSVSLDVWFADRNKNTREEFYGDDLIYLWISTKYTSVHVYIYEWYPHGNAPSGHWLIYARHMNGGGIYRIGPFYSESYEPEGIHTWKVWLYHGGNFDSSISRFDYKQEEKPKEPEDSDNDGVADSSDECHNPGCYEVDSRGCPKDSDDDGLRDCDDECDFTPGPRSNNGCPEEPEEETDSDGDGWSDEQEQRAGTNPYNVDTDGDDIWDPQDPSPLKAEEKESSLSSGLVIIGFILGLRSLRRK
jgi:hypothetical protein